MLYLVQQAEGKRPIPSGQKGGGLESHLRKERGSRPSSLCDKVRLCVRVMWFELTVLYSCFITVLNSICCIIAILKCIFHGICDLVTICRMGNAGGKSDEIGYPKATCPRPRTGTCVRYMFDKYGPDSVRDVANWCVWTMNSKLPFPENGTFDRDCLNHLRKVLEEKGKDKKTSRYVPIARLPGAGGVQAIYRPWGTELRAIANDMPKVREDLQKFQRELRLIVECHQPINVDMNILWKLDCARGVTPTIETSRGMAK